MESMPPEARRRGKVDTLFSAEWFEGESAMSPEEMAEKVRGALGADAVQIRPVERAAEAQGIRRQTVILLVVAVALIMLAIGAVLGLAVAAGVAYFLLFL